MLQAITPVLRIMPLLGNTKCHLCKTAGLTVLNLLVCHTYSRLISSLWFFGLNDLLVQHTEKEKRHQKLLVYVLYPRFLESKLSCREKAKGVMSLEVGDIWMECICRTHHYTVSPHQDIALRGSLPGNAQFTEIRATHFPIQVNLNLQHLNEFRGNGNSHFWRGQKITHIWELLRCHS